MLKKKVNIDFIRFIAALLVVAIHTYPFNDFNDTFDYIVTRIIFRILVPLFLMITGYFVLPKALEDKNNLKKYLVKIGKMYLISMLIFFPLNIYKGYFNHFKIELFLKDIFFDGTFYHLWYFPAVMLGLVINYILLKKLGFKKSGLMVLFFYIVGLFGDSYYGLIRDNVFLSGIYDIFFLGSSYTRNGLFYTPIFLYIGYFFRKSNFKLEIKENILLIIICLVLLVGEGLTLYFFNILRHNSMYLMLIPLSFLVFSLIVNNCLKEDRTYRTMANYIYIVHPLVIAFWHFFVERVNFKILSNSLASYIFILIITIVMVLIFKKSGEIIKNGKRNNKE